jgi:hypothetical protein
MVTDEQVRKLRQKMSQGKTQEIAAVAAGMSERSARTWQEGPLPSARERRKRWWRTRPDALAGVWEADVVPLLAADTEGVLEAHTVLGVLEERHTGQFSQKLLRTLQRRMRDWRALHGPEKEVWFQQDHGPGKAAALDFTHGTELGVTVQGELLVHLLFELVLCCSKWVYACVAFGETFEALVTGMQSAFWKLGGVPEQARHDSLSAATHELKHSGGRALNKRFAAVLDHYGVSSSRINVGKSRENGVVEKRHHLTKKLVSQELVLRGSREFETVVAYEQFVVDTIEKKHNRSIADALELERPHLSSLPTSKVPCYTAYWPRVSCWSTIQVAKRPYSVPSRLVGHTVEARQYPDVVEVRCQDRLVLTMPRVRAEDGSCINYRHVIWSLVKKPGAFAHYRYREALFPTLVFRRAYDALCARTDRADVEYVRILHLAASTMQATVEQALVALLDAGTPFDYVTVQQLAAPRRAEVPTLSLPAPDLSVYDGLLGGAP